MSSAVVTTRSPIRRAIAGFALLAAVGAGTSAALVEHGGSHAGKAGALRSTQCWYKGWFKEDGVWYYGWFLESC